MTTFIFISSAGHAAANSGQYNQYGFPPNYPSIIHGERPKSKVRLVNQLVFAEFYSKFLMWQYYSKGSDYVCGSCATPLSTPLRCVVLTTAIYTLI